MEIDVTQYQDKRKLVKKMKPQVKYSKTDSKYYNCGKRGHFKKECHSLLREYEKKRDNCPLTMKYMIQLTSKGKVSASLEAKRRHQLGLSI